MRVIVRSNVGEASKVSAGIIADLIWKKPDCVLGLTTGATMIETYRELIRIHRKDGLDFSKVTTFNLDEYIGLPPQNPQSFHYFMWEYLFKSVNIDPRFVHIPSGTAKEMEAYCDWYENAIKQSGGIDLQLLGIGENGHIAFNEPGSSLGSRTRIKTLSETTRRANSRFFKSENEVPAKAITMGIGTIMDAKALLLLAFGDNKADAIQATIEGPIMAKVPATTIQLHQNATVVVDTKAAQKLEMDYE